MVPYKFRIWVTLSFPILYKFNRVRNSPPLISFTKLHSSLNMYMYTFIWVLIYTNGRKGYTEFKKKIIVSQVSDVEAFSRTIWAYNYAKNPD